MYFILKKGRYYHIILYIKYHSHTIIVMGDKNEER